MASQAPARTAWPGCLKSSPWQSHNTFNLPGRQGPRPHRLVCQAAGAGSGSSSGSTQQLPTRLVQLYCNVQHPAYTNTRYSTAVLEFVKECILFYECGFTESDLAAQLGPAVEQHTQEVAGRPSGIKDFTEEGFMQCVIVVWVALMLSPTGVRRWAKSPAVSHDTLQLWRGFVTLIVTAYFEKRMAWYPLDRLQLELTVVQGSSPPQDIVAEKARLVFTTLERVYPQFPSD